ncbi:uncharacterized protein METZ01_LOCUS410498, partial [marine metagenome]
MGIAIGLDFRINVRSANSSGIAGERMKFKIVIPISERITTRFLWLSSIWRIYFDYNISITFSGGLPRTALLLLTT